MNLLNFYKKNRIMYTITVHGDCMSPTLNNGDIVHICPCEQYYAGDIIVCMDKNGARYIHRIYEITEGRYITKADNNLYIDENPITYDSIYGKVVL